jgi:hypothetical protein
VVTGERLTEHPVAVVRTLSWQAGRHSEERGRQASGKTRILRHEVARRVLICETRVEGYEDSR